MVKAVCRLVQRRSVAKNNAENEACITSSFEEWIDQSKGMAHRWRYARAERIADNPHLPRLSFAGDAWSEPVGTAGAALLSAAWATAELLWEFYQSQEVKSISVQSTLF